MENGGRVSLGESAEGLQPIEALRLYLEGKEVDSVRQQQIIQRAQELIELDAAEHE